MKKMVEEMIVFKKMILDLGGKIELILGRSRSILKRE